MSGAVASTIPATASGCQSDSGRSCAAPVYVDIYPLLAKHLTGIGRFVARLVESLARLTSLRLITTIGGSQARSVNLSGVLLAGQEIPVDSGLPGADGDVAGWARQLLRLPRCRHDERQARRSPCVFTALRPSLKHFRRELNILHDFTPLLLPWSHTSDTRQKYGVFFAKHSMLCDKAVAISAATKADAGWLFALPAQDVVVGYPGPSLCVHTHSWPRPVQRSSQMILVVSTLEPRKNTDFLLDWFFTTSVLPPVAKLCWVGPTGWLSDSSLSSETLVNGRRVVQFLGVVPDRRLCELYRRAASTIYPSLYEGFGFPVLDSLRHGAPVLCSFNSSLQEFAGPGVFFFDPCDAASLDNAHCEMRNAQPFGIDLDALNERFSWDRLARTVLDLCA
ncbi:MAG TPA: glycosyltransferase family 1 protein [Gemmataceae bacterium]|nr:glycosyltransferase family 1 protein [Gemmataceae bacterium]